MIQLPDFEGGFITKDVSGNFIITRDNNGDILNTDPVNVLRKGLRTDFGTVEYFDGDDVVLDNRGREIRANRFLFNAYQLRTSNVERRVQSEKLSKSVSGTFETPLGEVEVKNMSEEIGFLLMNPDLIIDNGEEARFQKSLNGKKYTAIVSERLIDKPLVKSLSVVSDRLPVMSDRFKTTGNCGRLLMKSFDMFKQSAPTTAGTSSRWNEKGGVKPDHKYLERKPNPNGEGYIYLYELPNGKREWRDKEGNKAAVSGKQLAVSSKQKVEGKEKIERGKEEKKEALTKYDFKEGDYVKKGDKIGKILRSSDNWLAVKFEGEEKPTVINKQEHIKKIEEQKTYREGQQVKYDGRDVKIMRLSANLVLVKDEKNKFDLIVLEKELEKTESPEKKMRGGQQQKINKYSYVQQGYGELEKEHEINYEEQPEYKEFDKAASEAGFEKLDDTTRKKYVDIGNEKHSMTWDYNPYDNKIEFLFDGVKDYTLDFMDENYYVRDVNDQGYSLEDSKTHETGIFLSYEDYDKWRDEEEKEEESEESEERKEENVDRYGGMLIGNKKQSYSFKPEYTDEELARFQHGKGRMKMKGRTSAKSSVSSMEEIQKENEIIQQKIKDVLKGEAYSKFKKQIEGRGFEFKENLFIGSKQVTIDGRKFEAKAEFNPHTQQYTTSVNGPVQNIELDGASYPITDISANKVYYQKGNFEKEISMDKLKEKNGKGIFKPLSEGNRTYGRAKQIKLANGEVHEGRYALVDLKDIKASHDEKTFKSTEGYPIDESGQNINDRDYENDKNLQEIVRNYAKNLDPDQLINNNPTGEGTPIITRDGVVVSGNNRVMSSKLAEAEHPERYEEYKKRLAEELEFYGIEPDELNNYMQPYLVRVDESVGKLSKSELAKYNQDMKKGEAETAATIKYYDILKNTAGSAEKLIDIAKDFDTQSELFQSKEAQDKIKKVLLDTKIVTENKISDYFTSDGLLTKSGQNIAKQLFTASVLEPDTIRTAEVPGVKEIANNVTDNIAPLLVNKGIGNGFSLNKEINNAINLQYRFSKSALKESGASFEDYITQRDVFNNERPDYKAIALNYLAKKGSKAFSAVLKKYNEAAKLNEDAGMFGGFTPEEVFDQMVLGSVKLNNKGEESPVFGETEKKIISGLQKSLGSRLIRLVWRPLRKSLDKAKLVLRQSKKNPAVKRWQSIEDANKWIDDKATEYGSKNKFLTSDEYKNAYPEISDLYKQTKNKFSDDADKAMKEVGAKFGDSVEYSEANPFGEVFVYEGKIINRNGVPYVNLSEKTRDGKNSVRWHKGFKKVNVNVKGETGKINVDGKDGTVLKESDNLAIVDFGNGEKKMVEKSKLKGKEDLTPPNRLRTSGELKTSNPPKNGEVNVKGETEKVEVLEKRPQRFQPNTVFRIVKNNDGELLGIVAKKYDGTKEGAIEAAKEITKQTGFEFQDFSNIQSVIGAVDNDGNPKYTIAPNFNNIADVNTERDKAMYIWGNLDNVFGKQIGKTKTTVHDYPNELSHDEMMDFIEKNKLRDRFGRTDYEGAKEIAGAGDKFVLKEIPIDKFDWIAEPRKRKINLPVIARDLGDGDFEILDGKHRIGEARARGEKKILAYVGVDKETTENPIPQTETENFKKWFGDWENDPENASKVVNKYGKPIVVYHGTNKKFTEFSMQRLTDFPEAAYFTDKVKVAQTYANNMVDVMKVYLRIVNPYYINAQNKTFNQFYDKLVSDINYAKENGRDGVIISNVRDDWGQKGGRLNGTTYIVFEPNQIKSAIGNDGSFDPKNPNITKSLGKEKISSK